MQLFKTVVRRIVTKAQSPAGNYILVLMAFLESVFSVFPFSILFATVALTNIRKSYMYALISTLSAVAGAIVAYYIGRYAWLGPDNEFTPLALFFFKYIPGFTMETYSYLHLLFSNWSYLIIIVSSLTPIPFELVTISSGLFDVNLLLFILAATIGRALRYYLFAYLLIKFGEQIKTFITGKQNRFAIGMVACFVTAFFIIKLVL